MTEHTLLGPWVRRFLLEHLVAERNLAANTQRSYRDTLRLLLPFAARSARKGIDRLQVEDLSAAWANWARSGAGARRLATSVWRPSAPWRTSSACAARSKSRGARKSVLSRSRKRPSRW
jgi:site-specific recombinase XerC